MKVACVQLNSSEVLIDNLLNAQKLIRQAVLQGAQFVATPEVTDQMLADRSERLSECYTLEGHPGVEFFAKLAADLSIHLLIGSMIIKSDDHSRLFNRSFLFAPDGRIQATYDKIHLCDTELPTGERYQESACYTSGQRAVVTDVSGLKLGMTICRDLRFGRMYRALAREGADIITVPSAWLASVGRLHWEVLLRARAIETGCYIIAPDQVGEHSGGRKTFGNSMIVNPWGEVVQKSTGEGEDIIFETLDEGLIQQSRRAIPSLQEDPGYIF